LDTLHNTDSIAVEASGQRLDLALAAGVLPMALDAAHSAVVTNPIESMISHQLSASHTASPWNWSQWPWSQSACRSSIRVRVLNDAPRRMMGVCQDAYLVLLKAKSGGKQTVVVRHIHVAGGGQAVIAGEFSRSTGEGGEEEADENGRNTPWTAAGLAKKRQFDWWLLEGRAMRCS
jgi:hypothetical protein